MRTTIVGIAFALSCCGTVYGASDFDNIKLEFTVAVPKSKANDFAYAVEHNADYPPCVNRSDLINPGGSFFHKPLAAHLRPREIGPGAETYIALLYSCQKTGNVEVTNNHYKLFTGTALIFANQKPEYPVRVLVDTTLLPEENCPRNYCGADGLLHHAPAACACKYCGAC